MKPAGLEGFIAAGLIYPASYFGNGVLNPKVCAVHDRTNQR